MNIFYFIYRVLTIMLAATLLLPFLLFVLVTGKYRKHLKERFGFIPDKNLEKFISKPKIWIHAVSLGEIKVADSVIHSLEEQLPGCSFLLSTATEHGRDLAIKLLGDKVSIIYAPVDLFPCVKMSLRRVKPDILIFLETEIWPSWIIEAYRSGIKIALLNGRISRRSFKSYLKLKPFLIGILSCFNSFSMISGIDKERITGIGADPDKTFVNGNAKFDMLISQTSSGMNEKIRNTLYIDHDAPVIIAGSTRTGEEEIILKAFFKITEHFPHAVLIIAPRHLERLKDIEQLLEKDRAGYHLKSDLEKSGSGRKNRIILIDSYGELFNIYSTGSIVFCGASLIPQGGQNVLEPAAWGVPVFHGPYMDDFLDAANLLRKFNASTEITGADDFSEKALYLLNNHDLLKQKGLAGKEALMENRDASKKHAAVVSGIIDDVFPKTNY